MNWLYRTNDWLLVLDNLDDISRLAPFIVPDNSSHAPVSGCHVLDVSLSPSIPVSGILVAGGVDIPDILSSSSTDKLPAPAPGWPVRDVSFSSIAVSGVPVSRVTVF